MNERIRELADEAFVTVSSDGYFSSGKFCEKFAELIVQECANVAADHEALDIYEEIREHFGVEE
jgi:peroxiredoxin